MSSRLFSIVTLSVFFILLLSGLKMVPAIIKSATVFICLFFGFKICRSTFNLIKKTEQQDSEPSTGQDSTETSSM